MTLFQSSYSTVLIKPMFYKNINNLEQFADTRQNILIKYPAMLTDIFPEDSSETYRVLHTRMFVDTRPELTALDIINMGHATVTRKTTLRVMKEDTLVHLVPECPRNYNLAFVLAANSVFLEPINAIILDIISFGLVKKWIEDAEYAVKLESVKMNPPESSSARVLNLNDIQLPFFILFFGVFIALIVFVVEKVLK